MTRPQAGGPSSLAGGIPLAPPSLLPLRPPPFSCFLLSSPPSSQAAFLCPSLLSRFSPFLPWHVPAGELCVVPATKQAQLHSGGPTHSCGGASLTPVSPFPHRSPFCFSWLSLASACPCVFSLSHPHLLLIWSLIHSACATLASTG